MKKLFIFILCLVCVSAHARVEIGADNSVTIINVTSGSVEIPDPASFTNLYAENASFGNLEISSFTLNYGTQPVDKTILVASTTGLATVTFFPEKRLISPDQMFASGGAEIVNLLYTEIATGTQDCFVRAVSMPVNSWVTFPVSAFKNLYGEYSLGTIQMLAAGPRVHYTETSGVSFSPGDWVTASGGYFVCTVGGVTTTSLATFESLWNLGDPNYPIEGVTTFQWRPDPPCAGAEITIFSDNASSTYSDTNLFEFTSHNINRYVSLANIFFDTGLMDKEVNLDPVGFIKIKAVDGTASQIATDVKLLFIRGDF